MTIIWVAAIAFLIATLLLAGLFIPFGRLHTDDADDDDRVSWEGWTPAGETIRVIDDDDGPVVPWGDSWDARCGP